MSQAGAITRKSGRKSRLTPELIAKVRELAPSGAPESTIAAACGVSGTAWWTWRRNAKDGVGTEMEVQLSKALTEGRAEGELKHLLKIHEGDSKDSQWMLTHSRCWSKSWSDDARIQREMQKVLSAVVDAIEATPSLSIDQRHDLLLQLQARGLGRVLTEAGEDDADD